MITVGVRMNDGEYKVDADARCVLALVPYSEPERMAA